MAAPTVLSREEYSRLTQLRLGTSDFQLLNCEERRLSEDPMGLLGDHLSATLTVQRGKERSELEFFIKTLPKNENQVKVIEQTGAFNKEVMFYSVLVKELRSVNVICEESLTSVAQFGENKKTFSKAWLCHCYFTRPDVLVLQDLTQWGYFGFQARDVLDFHHTTIILKKLALFHASSLVLEEKQTQKLGKPYRINEIYPKLISETFYVNKPNHPGIGIMEASVRALSDMAKLLPICKAPDVQRIIDEKLPGEFRMILEFVKPSTKYRNVVCHADLWSNNILCRYGDDGHPIDAKLVDFQLIRYTPPSHDIFNFLHLMTRRAFREEYLQEFLAVYYRTLSEELRGHGLDPDSILPWSELLESSVDQQRFGRINACHCLHFVIMDREVLRNIMMNPELYERVVSEERAEIVCREFKRDPAYCDRMTEVLGELLECHVLNK